MQMDLLLTVTYYAKASHNQTTVGWFESMEPAEEQTHLISTDSIGPLQGNLLYSATGF